MFYIQLKNIFIKQTKIAKNVVNLLIPKRE